ncbi:MAG: ParB/RepB/Spo0J family partition protein [Bdellovibrionota bacterium]
MSEIIIENKNKKKALGRGLGSLFNKEQDQTYSAPKEESFEIKNPIETTKSALTSETATPAQGEGRVWQISIEKIKAGAYQPRNTFEKESLEELAQSIRQNGILQPIIVRKTKDASFEIVAGERRWRAAQIAGLHEVPILIKNFNDKEALELAIIENIQREDLNPIEEAQGYARLVSEFKLSQQQVAERVGKDRATVANLLRVLSLPVTIQNQIESELLSLGHAKVLLSLPDTQAQVEFAQRAVSEKWSVRKLEKMISRPAQAVVLTDAAEVDVTKRLIAGLGDELQKSLGTKVAIDYNSGHGKISINFYSDEELSNLVDRLKQGCLK